MRLSFLILATVAISAAAAAQVGAPTLKMFGGFTPGLWQATPLDSDTRHSVGNGHALCLTSPATLIRDGAAAGDGCGYTVVEDAGDRATVTYSCKLSGSGRTTLTHVDDRFKVDAQGFTAKAPFETLIQYQRVGDCKK